MADTEMTIDKIGVSPTNQHVIILKEKEGERHLPIWILQAGADAIEIKLQNVDLARPMTHDLICRFADIAGWKISSAKIYRLQNDTFYAVLVIDSSGKRFEVDCMPSDAIAVSVRTHAPIFVAEEVLKKAGFLIDRETGNPIPMNQSAPSGKTDSKTKVTIPGIKCYRCDSIRVHPVYRDKKVCDDCGLIM